MVITYISTSHCSIFVIIYNKYCNIMYIYSIDLFNKFFQVLLIDTPYIKL